IGRLPRFHKWLNGKQSVIDSAEQNMLAFYREAPSAFWEILSLNFLWQALAVLEIYIILHFMGARIALLSAFVLESLTKLINLVGALNPGNIGTYEGGNMLITKLFGVTGTAGLTLALCRRARAVFWAAIGAICLILMKKQSGTASPDAIESA
ncbi:MAG TPA: lysylphosphatidylglycerol synthase domain-containing protein, partial [Candidatus Acidoferrum sp.]